MSQPNLDALNDLFTGVDPDFDPNASNNPRPKLGRGRYMVKRFFVKPTTKKGNIIAVDLVCVTPPSPEMKQGEACSMAFFVSETGLKVKYEKARARDFTCAMLGLPAKSETGPHQKRLCMPDNPGAGILIDITASQNGQYTNFSFEHVSQTPETILQGKQWLATLASAAPAANTYNPGTPPAYAGVPHAATGPVPGNVAPAPTQPSTPAAGASPLAGLFGNGTGLPF